MENPQTFLAEQNLQAVFVIKKTKQRNPTALKIALGINQKQRT